MAYMPKCWAKRKDCFANNSASNTCICLKSTRFRNGCPFYKPNTEINQDQIEESVKKYEEYKGIGRADDDDAE